MLSHARPGCWIGAVEARHVSRVSLSGGPERPLHEVVTVKPGLRWRPQDVGDARVMEYLPRRAADQVQNQPKREMCVAVHRAERSWTSEELSDIRHSVTESGVCPAAPYFPLVKHFLFMLSLPYGVVMYSLRHCMLEVYDLLFYFDFDRD